MKKRIIYLVSLCLILTAVAITANGQEVTHQQPKMTPEQRTDRRMEMIKKNLSLTDAQVPKMKELILAQEKLRETNKNEVKDGHKKMVSEMQKILTPEQMAKYKELQQQQKAKMQEQHKAQHPPQESK
jgi:Spy/CpxP family protein refolding chaperone